jgi:hypothetical protein
MLVGGCKLWSHSDDRSLLSSVEAQGDSLATLQLSVPSSAAVVQQCAFPTEPLQISWSILPILFEAPHLEGRESESASIKKKKTDQR